MQLRVDNIGPNFYLYRRNVPKIQNPMCQCEYPSQNVKHMIRAFAKWVKGRGKIIHKAVSRFFEALMSSPEDIARTTRWIQKKDG